MRNGTYVLSRDLSDILSSILIQLKDMLFDKILNKISLLNEVIPGYKVSTNL